MAQTLGHKEERSEENGVNEDTVLEIDGGLDTDSVDTFSGHNSAIDMAVLWRGLKKSGGGSGGGSKSLSDTSTGYYGGTRQKNTNKFGMTNSTSSAQIQMNPLHSFTLTTSALMAILVFAQDL
eukprot:CAMPEP_0183310382 /NCGR_PEP_ID=MMETSP0160_2-20130417/31138_1 /TAXON_ID=2839 ORGANISM="Odontella Sinensis, Strain Grunow 1884" /NCGR_SAMPLE_ID=MMETSP0160_2 /ASSEMBLY_ACC=CAM_ASM_000250 /LENGTH=122 /DNA_ID=CAMNT_0025474627 /DNA_START=197 /DNA_END=565 /DNA_ORIENTATION=+